MALTAKIRDIFIGHLPKNPKQILVAEDDATHFSIAHPKVLPWFSSPLATVHDHQHRHGEVVQEHTSNGSLASEPEREKQDAHVRTRHLRAADGEPELKRAHESSVIQLFYDLFFVANLTTFTSVHEINDADTLKSYVGFFGILWFTWLQVALFDIRFGVDSVFERICKGAQFGVMTGFAVVGPAYNAGFGDDPTKSAQALQAFQTLSMILMVSRLILLAQYSAVLFWLRKHRKAWAPMAIHMLVLLVAAMIFLGLFFSFGRASDDSSIIAWYVVITLEACVILMISGKYKFLSFRRTCIVERLGLLTLIILGEGVIGLCSSIQKVGTDQKFGSDIIGMIICGVVIIYTQWMLYFDQTEVEKVGTIRQLIWTIVHFPYHVSILLLVEGVSQLSVWRKLIDYWDSLGNILFLIPDPTDEETLKQYLEYVQENMTQFVDVFNEGLNHLKYVPPDLSANLTNLEYFWNQTFEPGVNVTNATNDAYETLNAIYFQGAVFAAENFGVEAPEAMVEHATDPTQILDALITQTFQTIFLYFFVCAGLSLILTGVLFLFGKRHKVRGDYLNIFFRTLMGVGLTLVSIMATSNNPDYQWSYSIYFDSPWILPTATIVFAVVVIVDNILINYVRRLVTGKDGYAPANAV